MPRTLAQFTHAYALFLFGDICGCEFSLCWKDPALKLGDRLHGQEFPILN